jgi:xanthine dehydrogenase YagR molybdenum-binding subunit
MSNEQIIGEPLSRVDGRLKVTGAAHYSGDMPVENVAYAVLITSSVPRGSITQMDIAAAKGVPGVLAVMTPFNAPRMPGGSIAEQSAPQQAQPSAQQGSSQRGGQSSGQNGSNQGSSSQNGGGQGAGQSGNSQNGQGNKPKAQQGRRPADRYIHLLQEPTIYFNGQPIGVVVAESFEHASYAASLVQVAYETDRPRLNFDRGISTAYTPKATSGQGQPADTEKGDAAAGWSDATVKLQQTYRTQVQTHNPMELHTTLARWDGDHLTLYDASQGIFGVRTRVAGLFHLPEQNVHVITKFIGGGFGSKGPVWSHVVLAAMAAREVGRPVKLVCTRRQQFGPVGFRGITRQDIRLGATQDGKLTLVQQDAQVQTSMFDEFVEPVASPTRAIYASPHIATTHRVVRLNSGTPSYTRGPGFTPGMMAVESAMDELAYALNMDPVELRLRNYAKADPDTGKPWSSKSLRECYQMGAERFGWSKRTPQPRSMRDGNQLVGYGMASALYPAHRSPAYARATLQADGTATVVCGTQDIGTGTYTIMTQVAAQALGLPVESVRFDLGDTAMPVGPHSGGSQTAASASAGVQAAANAVRSKIIGIAVADPQSPLYGTMADDIGVADGRLFLRSNPTRGETYASILARTGTPSVEMESGSQPGSETQNYSMYAFGAHFAEVRVDMDLGIIRVPRYVGVFACGKVLNAKTARSQALGGIVWGIGLALMEDTHWDPRSGRIMNADLAEYHVPVNADVPAIEVHFVEEHDPYVNPLGVKGMGEITLVGAPAAIANAVYHATGRRIREFPITIDKVM